MTTPNQTEYKITRNGEPPLRFHGTLIGSGSSRSFNSTRWTNIRIYRTSGGKYVAHVEAVTCWQGERDFAKARSFATPGELIDYLKGDESERLSHVAQEALEDAAATVTEFAETYVEIVD